MNAVAAPLTATERLAKYRSHHRIEVDRSSDWNTCDVCSLRVYQVVTRRWQHDLNEVRRLEKMAAAETVGSDRCLVCGRDVPKGSEEDFLSLLVADQFGLRPLCWRCQERGS